MKLSTHLHIASKLESLELYVHASYIHSLCGQHKPFVLWFFQGHPKERVILIVTNTRKKDVGETWRDHYAVVIINEGSGNGTGVVWSTLYGVSVRDATPHVGISALDEGSSVRPSA